MNSHLKKVKIYVISTALVIATIGGLVAYGLDRNIYFTPDYATRTMKSWLIAREFDATYAQAASEENNLQSTQLDHSLSVPVIVYHGIPESNMPDSFGITIEKFKDQLFALKKAGYESITTTDLYNHLKTGSSLPEKPILITFDDGRVDAFKLADPVLKALDYTATMFVIGKYSLEENSKYYISPKQIREMEAGGHWDIQAHSYDGHRSHLTAPDEHEGHFFSHLQWLPEKNRLENHEEFRQRIGADMKDVQDSLETLLDKEIHSFAYPFGDYGQNNTNSREARALALEETQRLYKMSFYQNDAAERYTNSYHIPEESGKDFFMVKRIIINSNWSGEDLLNELNKTAAKNLPFNDDFTDDKGWLVIWGDVLRSQNNMSLAAKPDETGSTIILDGSRLWEDYSVKATVSSPTGSGVYVWFRFQNDENNAACDFSNGFIHIEQTINGEKRIIKGTTNRNITLPSGDYTVEARVDGRNVQCILNGTQVVETEFLDENLTNGGVGLKTWAPELGKATLVIRDIEIEEIISDNEEDIIEEEIE